MEKLVKIAIILVPVALMIGLIPYVQNDYLLVFIYALIIIVMLPRLNEKNDTLAFMVGLLGMTISEYFFVSTGVETFTRNSLFGVMPAWLPLLWGYGFVAIKKVVTILA